MGNVKEHLKWAKGDATRLENQLVRRGKNQYKDEINATIRINKNLKAICEKLGFEWDSLL